ncbi:MAG TPA: C25 family cysteine peptidase, partial [Candidatus Cloacimonadota bacterium]|nr:C25 family cysteine peptidase [Candidatus Cloacimonadota bacterium]
DGSKVANWQPLADYYESRGISVLLKPLADILATSTGNDTQAKIRNYIIDFYTANPLRYVLLGGDTDLIPHRGFYVNLGTGSET